MKEIYLQNKERMVKPFYIVLKILERPSWEGDHFREDDVCTGSEMIIDGSIC